MMCVMKPTWLASLLALIAVPTIANAHLKITSHQSRYGDNVLKDGPCGLADGERTTDRVYIAKPGTQVNLVWDEYVNHPSFYRIDFDVDGDDDFADPILACADQTSVEDCFDTTNSGPYMVNNIPDVAAAVQNYLYTLPNVECDNCTLQVVQAMQDKPPFTTPGNEMYYQCIDIILSNSGPDELTLFDPLAPDAGPVVGDPDAGTPDAGPNDPDAGSGPSAGDAGNSPRPAEGGCQTSGTSAGGLWLVLLAGALWRRRSIA